MKYQQKNSTKPNQPKKFLLQSENKKLLIFLSPFRYTLYNENFWSNWFGWFFGHTSHTTFAAAICNVGQKNVKYVSPLSVVSQWLFTSWAKCDVFLTLAVSILDFWILFSVLFLFFSSAINSESVLDGCLSLSGTDCSRLFFKYVIAASNVSKSIFLVEQCIW